MLVGSLDDILSHSFALNGTNNKYGWVNVVVLPVSKKSVKEVVPVIRHGDPF
jgi:hypothetical protein